MARTITTAHRVSEQDGEIVVEPPIRPGIMIYLDRHPFTIPGVALISEHELRNLPFPAVADDMEIWLEQPNQDVLVGGRSIPLRGGERFYTTPRHITDG